MKIESAKILAAKLMEKHDIDWSLEFSNIKKRFSRVDYRKNILAFSSSHALEGSQEEFKNTVLQAIAHVIAWNRHKYKGHSTIWFKICEEIGANPVREKSVVKSGEPVLNKHIHKIKYLARDQENYAVQLNCGQEEQNELCVLAENLYNLRIVDSHSGQIIEFPNKKKFKKFLLWRSIFKQWEPNKQFDFMEFARKAVCEVRMVMKNDLMEICC